MTTLENINIGKTLRISAKLENQIIHDFNNGGCKSTYGLNTRQRMILIKVLLSANPPKCECVLCL
jgi:hypothetical protein